MTTARILSNFAWVVGLNTHKLSDIDLCGREISFGEIRLRSKVEDRIRPCGEAFTHFAY